MSEVEITTPRGVALAGTFETSRAETAVLLAHGFLADRHAGHFDELAAAYRAAGHATLQLDLSGCGASGDDVVTLAGHVEDLRAASSWLTEQGHPVQALHADGFGTLAALRARSEHVATMVLTNPITGPMSYPWEEIFSPEQLDELESYGFTRVPDDNPATAREHAVISRQTLADYSLVDPAELLGGLGGPVLLVHEARDQAEGLTQLELSREALPLLPPGSRLELVDGAPDLTGIAVAWVERHLG